MKAVKWQVESRDLLLDDGVKTGKTVCCVHVQAHIFGKFENDVRIMVSGGGVSPIEIVFRCTTF